MTILITFNKGDITKNDITYIQFYLKMTLPITVNKKHTRNVALIITHTHIHAVDQINVEEMSVDKMTCSMSFLVQSFRVLGIS
jgi:hypothetical protein